MSHPTPMHRPTVQQGRIAGPAPAAVHHSSTVERRITPMPPEPNRYNLRPVVTNAWGHQSLAGDGNDRTVVQGAAVQAASNTPLLCGVAAFLLGCYFAK